MGGFRSMKARELQRLLKRALGYEVTRQSGSHRRLEAPGRPPLTFAFHDSDTIAPGLVREILVKQVGLSEEEAEAVL
jgi:predicted RNA binding protein YcfA (HicA-like mRNA interferase family)